MAFYMLIDDYAGGVGTSAGTGNPVLENNFTADTLAHAQTLAQQFATLFQRSVRLTPVGVNAPYTLYTPAPQGSALGSQPTGIGW